MGGGSDENEYKETFKNCFIDPNVNNIHPSAFRPAHSAIDRQDAAQYALNMARKRLREMAAKQQALGDESESSDSEYDIPGNCPAGEFTITPIQKKFFLHLPKCPPLTTGFDIQGSTKRKQCFCPCGRDMKPWRDLVPMLGLD